MASIFGIAVLFSGLLFLLDENMLGTLAALLITGLVLMPIGFQYFQAFKWAKISIIVNFYLAILLIALLVGSASHIDYALLLFPFLAINYFRNSTTRKILVAMCFLGIVSCQYIFYYWEPLLVYPASFGLNLINASFIFLVTLLLYQHNEKMKHGDSERALNPDGKYKAIINGVLDGFILFDQYGKIIHWNEEASVIFSSSQKQAIGKLWTEKIFMPADASSFTFNEKREIVLDKNQWLKRKVEMNGRRGDGKPFPMELSIISFLNNGEQLFHCFIRDLSNRKAAEEQLLAVNQELQQFASVASHDMKEPLRTISSFSSLLERRLPKDNESGEFLAFIKDAAKRMSQLLDDLITYSKAGKNTEEYKEVDLNDVITIVKNNLYRRITEAGAEVRFSDLPTLKGQLTPFTQLFQNLIANGIKFNREGVPPIIHITAKQTASAWQIAISDNGIGLESIYYERIFEPFARLHTRDKFEGSGIGLATCKKIVERYGGKIWLESQKEIGTTFYFSIPKAELLTKVEVPQGVLEDN